MDALRLAPGPVTAGDIAAAAMRTKQLPAEDAALKVIVTDMVLTVLRNHLKRGAAVKTGISRSALWAIAPSLL